MVSIYDSSFRLDFEEIEKLLDTLLLISEGPLTVVANVERDHVLFAEYCDMTTTDLPPDTAIWIERDNITGPTGNDTTVKPGDPLDPNVKVQLGYCKEW